MLRPALANADPETDRGLRRFGGRRRFSCRRSRREQRDHEQGGTRHSETTHATSVERSAERVQQ
jgi:hypothetical protein